MYLASNHKLKQQTAEHVKEGILLVFCLCECMHKCVQVLVKLQKCCTFSALNPIDLIT